MRLSPTAKAAAVPSAGGSDSSRIGALLIAAWSMAHRWKGRIFYAVLDQAFASSSNFLLTILCVVWMPLDAFGRYVIVWSLANTTVAGSFFS